MKQQVDFSVFESAFRDYNRLDNFPTGLRALFEYLEEFEDSMGEEIELDVIALCCDYHEEKLSVVLRNAVSNHSKNFGTIRKSSWWTLKTTKIQQLFYQGF